MDTGQVRLDTAVVLALAWSGGYLLSTHCYLHTVCCRCLLAASWWWWSSVLPRAWWWPPGAGTRRIRSADIDIITWISSPGYLHLVSPVQGSGGGPLELAGELQVTSRHTELVAVARCGNLAKLRLPV